MIGSLDTTGRCTFGIEGDCVVLTTARVLKPPFAQRRVGNFVTITLYHETVAVSVTNVFE